MLVPKFPMLAFSCAVEPLRIANWLSGKQLYEWFVATVDGQPVVASNGLRLEPNGTIAEVENPDIVMLGAGVDGCFYNERKLSAWLRAIARRGATICGFGTGTWILARSGILDGHRCTIHWEDILQLREQFPGLRVTDRIFEIDGKRLTSSGGTATMDLVLNLISLDHGVSLAAAIAEEFMQERIRDGSTHQRMRIRDRIGTTDRRLLAAIALMERTKVDPMSLQSISRDAGSSRRNLERLFDLHLGCSPTEYYRAMRLDAARQLLLHGSRSVLHAAVATGFASASHFTRCYKKRFGRPPRSDRRAFSTPVSGSTS